MSFDTRKTHSRCESELQRGDDAVKLGDEGGLCSTWVRSASRYVLTVYRGVGTDLFQDRPDTGRPVYFPLLSGTLNGHRQCGQ